MAVATAVFVGIIADGVAFEGAGCCVAAVVVATAFFATTITFFLALDDAVAALLAGDGLDVSVVAQAISVDCVVANSAANVADGTLGEAFNAWSARRVHDESCIGITSLGGQWTALLSGPRVGLAACGGIAVVHSTESVTSLVGDDLPLLGASGANDNISSRHSFLASRCTVSGSGVAVLHGFVDARLSKPRKADCGSRVAS